MVQISNHRLEEKQSESRRKIIKWSKTPNRSNHMNKKLIYLPD